MADVAKRAQAVPLGAYPSDSRQGTLQTPTSASKTIMALQLLLVAVLSIAVLDTRGAKRVLRVSLEECSYHRLRADVPLLHPIQIRVTPDGAAEYVPPASAAVALSKGQLRERYAFALRDAAALAERIADLESALADSYGDSSDGSGGSAPSNTDRSSTFNFKAKSQDPQRIRELQRRRFANPLNLTHEMLTAWGGHGYDSLYQREEGWVGILARSPSKASDSAATVSHLKPPLFSIVTYNSSADLPIPTLVGRKTPDQRRGRYSVAPVPKGGGWQVQLPYNTTNGRDRIRMAEVAYAYDTWFERNSVFNTMGWMGVFCQQDPMDAIAIADMLWRVKPDLVIEIGTNSGGGAIFYSTIMRAYNPAAKIVTVDLRPVSNWNKDNVGLCVGCSGAIEHPWWHDGMITFVQGDVTKPEVRGRIEQEFVSKAKTVLVIEDASHTYPSTLNILEATKDWVTKGSYLLCQDTKMDRFTHTLGEIQHYSYGPMRSVDEFLEKNGGDFVIDRRFEYQLYSQHHRGWMRRK